MQTPKQLVPFYSPFAGLWPHAIPEALVARSLLESGADILYLVCDGLFVTGCTLMTAYHLTVESDLEAREKICQLCRKRRDQIISQLQVPTLALDTLIDKTQVAEIEQIASTINIENIEAYEVEGFPIGRIALHETILHFKLTALSEMSAPALADLKVKFAHVLMMYYISKRFIEEYKPDRFVTYNTHVSVNYTLTTYADNLNIPVFGLHAGGNMANRFDSLYVFKRDMVVLYKNWIARFEAEWMNSPSTKTGITNATQHFFALTSGKTLWVYSAAKSKSFFDVRKFFGIEPQQKVLLATLSSYDELFSSQMMGVMDTYPLLFPTQIEWMREVIAFLRERPDLFLIIRVHPRELPNRRDSLHSTHAKLLAQELVDLPENVKINWPADGISLYDLLPQVDVGLNGWSSAGKELAILGIPVVIYTKDILYYPSKLNLLAVSREHYFQCIDQAIAIGWSHERIILVFRWLAIEYTLGTIDISDSFHLPESIPSLWLRVINRLKRGINQRKQLAKIKKPLKETNKFAECILKSKEVAELQFETEVHLTETEEIELIQDQIKQIVNAIYAQIPNGHSLVIDKLRQFANGQL